MAGMLVSKVTASVMAKAGAAASSSLLAGLSAPAIKLSTAVLAPAASTLAPALEGLNIGTLLSESSDATLASCPIPETESAVQASPESQPSSSCFGLPGAGVTAKAAVAVIGGVAAVAAVPTLLGAVGFTTTGIAASSLAAKMMSVSAIASGGGVPAGGLVATLQSVGAAGLSFSSNVIVGSTGSAVAAAVAHAAGL